MLCSSPLLGALCIVWAGLLEITAGKRRGRIALHSSLEVPILFSDLAWHVSVLSVRADPESFAGGIPAWMWGSIT